MCPHCRAFITVDDKVCPYCDSPVGPRAIDRRSPGTLLGGLIPSAQFVTITILTINIGLFLVTLLASMKQGAGGGLMGIDVITLTKYGAARPDAVFYGGQWWRLLTAGFLHGGLMHILFNSWALMDIGSHAEEIYGQKRMVSIYLISTAGGFLASMFWTKSISVGASAGLFGLIGAMIAVGVIHKTYEAAAIKQFYLRWAVYGLLFGLLPLRIDNAAHIGGLATGFVVAWLAGTPKLLDTHWAERLWKAIMIVMLGLTGLSFALMFRWLMAVKDL